MKAAELDKLIREVDVSRVSAAWDKACAAYGETLNEPRYKGLDKLMVQKIATMKADAVFLEEVHQFVKH